MPRLRYDKLTVLAMLSSLLALAFAVVSFFLPTSRYWLEAVQLFTRLFAIGALSLFAAHLFFGEGAVGRHFKTDEERKTALFLCVYLFSQLLAFLFLIAVEGEATSSLLFQDVNDSFMDFFHSLCTAGSQEGYAGGSIYPPLSYLIFKLFARLVPLRYFDLDNQTAAAFDIRASQAGRVAFLLFLGVAVALFLWVAKSGKAEKGGKWRDAVGLLLLFSAPFVCAVERGNIVLLSMVALLFFALCNRSENRVVRELSLAALAFSAALKLIPGVFFLLLLFEKRYREFFRAGVYFAVMLFLPFLVFGGFSQVPVLLGNLLRGPAALLGDAYNPETVAHVATVSFSGVFNNIGTVLTGKPDLLPLYTVLGFLLTAVLLVLAFFQRGFRRTLALTVAMCGIFRFNAPYTTVYMLVPLFVFLREGKAKKRGVDALYTVLFVCMFSFFPAVALDHVGDMILWTAEGFRFQTLTVFVQNALLLVFAAVLIAEFLIEVCYAHRTEIAAWWRAYREALVKKPQVAFLTAAPLMLMLFLAVPTAFNRLPFGNFAGMLFYQLFCMLLPGFVLLHILKIRFKNVIYTVGFSYAVGYCISVLSYIVLIPLSLLFDGWMWGIPVLNFTLAAASLAYVCITVKRKTPLFSHDGVLEFADVRFFLLLLSGVFLIYFLVLGLPNRLPGMGEQAYYVDTLYWIGNTISLSRGFPPASMRGVGEIISYHYFSSIQMVSMHKTVGISLQALSLAFSPVQSSVMIALGAYCLFSHLLKKRSTVSYAVLLLLFSMGACEQTGIFMSAHMLTGPFGFDYAMGLSFFAVLLLVGWLQRGAVQKHESLIFLCFLLIGVGTKAPIGVLLLAFEGCTLFWTLLKAKPQKRKIISYGVLSVILFAAVCVVFMSNAGSWIAGSTVKTPVSDQAGLSISWEGTSQFAPILRPWYTTKIMSLPWILKIPVAIFLFLRYIFAFHMAIVTLFLFRFVRMLRHRHTTDAVQWISIITFAVGVIPSLFISMQGGSQVYFIEAATLYALIFALYEPQAQSEACPPRLPTLVWGKRVLVGALSLMCVYSTLQYTLPIVSDAFVTQSTGKVRLTSRFAYNIESSTVTSDEYEGYRWVRENTDSDAILISNATVSLPGPLMTNVFTERRMFVESNAAPSVGREEADLRIGNIRTFLAGGEGAEGALSYLIASDVDYVIVLTRFKTGNEPLGNLPLVFANGGIEIYRLY